MIGSTGTKGTLKERGRSGRLRRSTTTPIETSTKAASVPMFTRCASSESGMNEARIAMMMPAMMVRRYGVLKRGWVLASQVGSRPSRAIAKPTRDWPMNRIMQTTVRPMQAPIAMRSPITGRPTFTNAVASGAPSDGSMSL
jgi:hypothetical protein